MAITRRTFLKGLGAAVLTGCAAESANTQGGKVIYPFRYFGDTQNLYGMHSGQDFGAGRGTPLAAVSNGVISHSFYDVMGGEMIDIKLSGNNSTRYGHLDKRLKTTIGEIVFRGQIIGTVGDTGKMNTIGNHLHFSVYSGGTTVDPQPFWANGKPITYDGVTDYDKAFREGGKLQLSAPFIGPVPHGNVNLEKIVATANTKDIETFANNPQQHSQQLFEASMALIGQKQKRIAQDLAGLPILNDNISTEEALSVYKLWETIKDEEFPKDFAEVDKTAQTQFLDISGELYITWGHTTQKSKDYDVRVKTNLPQNLRKYSRYTRDLDKDVAIIPEANFDFQIKSEAHKEKLDGIILKYFTGRGRKTNITLSVNGKEQTFDVIQLMKEQKVYINEGDTELRIEKGKMPENTTTITPIENIIFAGKGQRWNHYLQEVIRYGQTKEILQLFENYAGIEDLTRQMWK